MLRTDQYVQGDGAYPLGNLALGGDGLYGTTSAGGTTNSSHGNYSGGTIFYFPRLPRHCKPFPPATDRWHFGRKMVLAARCKPPLI